VWANAQFDINQLAEAEGKAAMNIRSGERAGADENENVVYNRLQLQVDPAVNYIMGRVTTYFIPNTDITFIEFDLTDSLQVDSVIFHGANIPFSGPTDNVVHIELPGGVNGGVVDSIDVFYKGVPGRTGFGSFVQSYHGEDSIPIVWTLSEPYGAKDWWPCKQNLHDKIDSIDIIVTTPAQYRAASNGLLVSETDTGGYKTYHWQHRYPIATYLVCFAVTNYQVYSDYVPFNGDTLEVLNYVYPESWQDAHTGTAELIPIMQLYDTLFGLYAFSREKYGHAQFGWGGGMEHQTMTFVGAFNYELLAHELGHHWFGDKVTCDSWQEIWLNEGLATYLSGLTYQYIKPQYWQIFKSQKIASIVSQPDGSVYCYDTSSVRRIFDGRLTYSKGCMVLNSLRWVIGDSAFFGGLRNYLNDPERAYKFASTPDLEHHLEQTSGIDLTDFFNSWVYAEGYPSYKINWSQDYSGTVSMSVEQTQSHPSVSFYTMPLPLLFMGADRDTMVVLNNTSSGQQYTFKLPFLADTLIFDPDLNIISANDSVIRASQYNFTFFLYPNPVVNTLQVRVDAYAETKADILISNSAGQAMYVGSYTFNTGSSVLKFDTRNYAVGVYNLKIETADKIITSKFIKGRP
jgi:aminopeptidase N